MTPRERVLESLNHRQPDRPAIDFASHRSSSIAAIAYVKLREALGLEFRPPRVYDMVQQLAVVEEDVLDRFGIDTIEMGRGFALEDKHWVDWTLPDGTPCQVPAWAVPERQEGMWVMRAKSGKIVAKMPDGVLYFEQCHWPLAEEGDPGRLEDALGEIMWAALRGPPGPLADGPDGEKLLADGARAFRERTDRAVVGLFGGNLMELGQFLYRMDNFLMLLAVNPEHAHEFLDRMTVIHMANLERFLGAVGPYIDVIGFADDLGTQNGPQISTAMYREFFKPRHEKLWQRAKELADVKVLLHCCGGIRPLLDDLIEAGADAVNPVQISCAGMDARELKRDFGDRLTFWGGGCDTHQVLAKGTPEDVRRHVKEQTSILSPGGGFVFQQVHNILANVRPENIIAMFDAARGE